MSGLGEVVDLNIGYGIVAAVYKQNNIENECHATQAQMGGCEFRAHDIRRGDEIYKKKQQSRKKTGKAGRIPTISPRLAHQSEDQPA